MAVAKAGRKKAFGNAVEGTAASEGAAARRPKGAIPGPQTIKRDEDTP